MERVFSPALTALRGTVSVPGDKSLSHRAVLFAAIAEGTSLVSGVLDSADVRATVRAVSALGASVELCSDDAGALSGSVTGWGGEGPRRPGGPIDCGNSGTTARLLMGVLSGWPLDVTLTGDDSLSRRPMKRVTEPLAAMGAGFETATGGTLPVTVHGSPALGPLAYDSPVASAQVKTALLLAGLRAHGTVTVTEPALSRDHTERLLPAFGVSVASEPTSLSVSLTGPQVPRATTVTVPRDPSSAAFMVAAALLVPGSEIVMPGVSLNPTRIGFLRVLERMGADLEIIAEPSAGAEPVGTLIARFTPELSPTVVTPDEVPSLVDEIPVLALIASQAHGTTRFVGVGELRVKESDRLAAVHDGLAGLGCGVRSGEDWLEVDGAVRLAPATLDSLGDHRLAMCWALAGLAASGPVTVTTFGAVDVSYPAFAEHLANLSA